MKEQAWTAWLVEQVGAPPESRFLTIMNDGVCGWANIDAAIQFKTEESAKRATRSLLEGAFKVCQHQWGHTDQLWRPPNLCDGIFSHKYLSADCVERGCHFLFLDETLAVLDACRTWIIGGCNGASPLQAIEACMSKHKAIETGETKQ